MLNGFVVKNVAWEQSLEVVCQFSIANILLIEAEKAAKVIVIVH